MCPKQIVNSRAFKLPFLKGKYNSDGSLDCHGLPLFAREQLQDKEEAIGWGSHGLVFVARNNSEKVVIKKLLGGDENKKLLFPKETKILHGIKSEHKVKFKAVCMESFATILEYLFFDFTPFSSSEIVWTNFFHNFFKQIFKTELMRNTLRIVVAKLLYSQMHFV